MSQGMITVKPNPERPGLLCRHPMVKGDLPAAGGLWPWDLHTRRALKHGDVVEVTAAQNDASAEKDVETPQPAKSRPAKK